MPQAKPLRNASLKRPVQSAAENYFRKDVRDLTLAEMTLIAGLPQAPSDYSPVRNPSAALQRRHECRVNLPVRWIVVFEDRLELLPQLVLRISGGAAIQSRIREDAGWGRARLFLGLRRDEPFRAHARKDDVAALHGAVVEHTPGRMPGEACALVRRKRRGVRARSCGPRIP